MKLYLGNCIKIMPKKLEAESIGAIVTDPPYGLEFMGKDWDKNFDKRVEIEDKNEGIRLYLGTGLSEYKAGIDYQKWTTKWALQAFRVLKLGGLIAVLGHTRTYHRMACGIEDAGFEVVDMLEWVYASGFPKAYDISKGFDKKAGAKREIIGQKTKARSENSNSALPTLGAKTKYIIFDVTKPKTELAKKWNGWKNPKGLKPAHEPILLAQKPIKKGYSIIENIEEFGVGGINIEACRIPFGNETDSRIGTKRTMNPDLSRKYIIYGEGKGIPQFEHIAFNDKGRFAPNLLVMDDMLNNGKETVSRKRINPKPTSLFGIGIENFAHQTEYSDSGSFSRYFDLDAWFKSKFPKLNLKTYPFLIVPKPSKAEKGTKNIHPTVKPIKLTSYLIKLICPRDQIILDPFLGSGTTLVSAKMLDYNGIGIEKERKYFEIAKTRLKATKRIKRLW